MVRMKRIYDVPTAGDGFRILIDRLWPRGLSKEEVKVDLWLKDIAPSHELRKWFSHDPNKWGEFKKKYLKELNSKKELVDQITQRTKKGNVTLLFGPAGRDLGPAIPAADKAIVDGKIEPVVKLLTDKMRDGINEYFKHVVAKKNFKKDDVEAGRNYIEAYVIFIHYVEGLHEATKETVHGHYPEHEEGGGHKD